VKFFDWAFKNGAPAAAELDYVPLPATVVKQVQAAWKSNLKDASGKAIY
jgi:phosphate transport system substrate-binding protein